MNRFKLRNKHVLLFGLSGVAAISATGGIAFASGSSSSSGTIGTGVVVIETSLGYQGGQAAGTGMVLTSSGEILTNNHVVNGATAIRVVIPDSGQTYDASVVGYSPGTDVAVVQIKGASNLKTISTGDSSSLQVGQAVTALGNAGGTGSFTAASGHITGLDRTITAGDEQGGDSEQLAGMIETDANVQPGDSGGPLFDANGQAIGMDTAASSGGPGYAYGYGQQPTTSDAYAIPIAHALDIARQIEAGSASDGVHVGGTAFLGVQVQAAGASSNGYDPYGYGSDPYGYGGGATQAPSASGAVIAGTVSGGPADAAGLSQGDTITAVDGQAIDSPDALTALLQTRRPGDQVSITVTDQSGNQSSVSVTLESGPAR